MKNPIIENSNAYSDVKFFIEDLEALNSGGYIFPTRFLQMYKKFKVWDELEIQIESVAAYVGEFGMILNAKCNNKRIGIGVHPTWMRNENGSIIHIDTITYVLMTSNEIKKMISYQKSKNNIGCVVSPGELVFIDEFEFEIQCTKGFMKMMRALF